jgi:TatD DNase family protein
VFYDAHNHLQDERLLPLADSILAETRKLGIRRMVVNGSCESDWDQVIDLSRRFPEVLPSLGYHPWYVNECTPAWRTTLIRNLDRAPCAIGEIGLDRWIENYDSALQEEVFLFQLEVAAARNLPASIHCLKAWGRLYELLSSHPRPSCGFLLHSYGGPAEMVQPFAKLGAYFSFPGYFALERKTRQREVFLSVPLDRLLVETDAPDQCLPPELEEFVLKDPASRKPINHPANLQAVYRFLATFLGIDPARFCGQMEMNFQRLFGTCISV